MRVYRVRVLEGSVGADTVPPFLAAALLAYFSILSAGLPLHGAAPGSIYFCADYTTQQKMMAVGIDRLRVEYSDLGFGGAGLVEDSGVVVS